MARIQDPDGAWPARRPTWRSPTLRPPGRRRRRPGGAHRQRSCRAGRRRALVPTGVRVAIPEGYAGFVQPRSGLALRHGVTLANSPGLIDAGYRDEIAVIVINTDPADDFEIRRGDRIAQLVVQQVEHARSSRSTSCPVSERGIGGFGHTGTVAGARAPRGGGPGPSSSPRSARAGRSSVPRSAALSALKTYDPPLGCARGAQTSLASAPPGQISRPASWTACGWSSTWPGADGCSGVTSMPPARARPGKGPLALRVGLSGGSGFDVTEQGTEKRLALWVVRDLDRSGGAGPTGTGSARPRVRRGGAGGDPRGQSGQPEDRSD